MNSVNTIKKHGKLQSIQTHQGKYCSLICVLRLRRLTKKFNDPRFKISSRVTAKHLGTTLRVVKLKRQEPRRTKLTVNGDLFQRKMTNSTERPKCHIEQLKRPANDQTTLKYRSHLCQGLSKHKPNFNRLQQGTLCQKRRYSRFYMSFQVTQHPMEPTLSCV